MRTLRPYEPPLLLALDEVASAADLACVVCVTGGGSVSTGEVFARDADLAAQIAG